MPRAVSLTDQILSHFGTKIGEWTLIPSGGGVFEVKIDGELIFSKKALDRFPEEGEVLQLLKSRIS